MLTALAKFIGAPITQTYKPCKTLFLYGWGGSEQQRAVQAHDGDYACFDLGYWRRESGPTRHWRVSLNGWHCPERIMAGNDPSPKRFDRYQIQVAKRGGDPDGPILLVGSSPKSIKVGARSWSQKKCAELRGLGKPIWYKPKPGRKLENVDADRVVDGDIFDILPRVSLVVCRHSNVSVDAARMGVPCVCDDGAGAAIYPKDINGPQPDYDTRLRFLQRLAYWQWSEREIASGQFWHWYQTAHRLR